MANYFSFDSNETYGQMTTPGCVVHKELFSTTAGTRGLSTGMETIVGGIKRKWTATTWLSDSTTKPLYPRVTETNIYDDADGNGTFDNRRRATIGYTVFTKTQAQSTMPYTVYLPTQSSEYAANATDLYRYSQTDYVDDANYWTRWIVGLPTAQRLYDGANVLQAQTTYGYDEAWHTAHASAVLQHDSANYGSGFYWRGNRTSTRRYSVSGGSAGNYTETHAYYYLTGNVSSVGDALNQYTNFFYDDGFATYADDASNTETPYNLPTKTWAYPTRVQDPELNSAYVKYWYDTGAVTRTTDPKGAAAISIYETTYGRLAKSRNAVNGAYTRYVYDTGHNWVQTWTTVNDMTETAVLSLLDGAGRERQHVDEHPGSIGTLSSWYRIYDIMGRVVEQSNPTEISSISWAPTGDDTAYIISTQTYDWNHRPWVTTNQDGTTRQINYTGCGCAGSNMIEAWGEEVQYTNAQGQVQTGRRKSREYHDVQGRTIKTETLNWDGSIFTSSTTDYNVRDQVTFGRAYQGSPTVGSCPTGTCQETKFEYDGYGRLWRRWLPNYKPLPTDPPSATQYDQYEYFANDTTLKVTDPRGAAMTYGYNSRNLVTSITYTVPSGVDPTSNVTFAYDAAGNRLWMDDGPGRVDYQYDALSRLQWEKRHFDDLTPDYQLTYEYNLVGQVKKVTDPWGASISYAFDKTGRVNGVTGTGYADINQYTNRAVSNFATGIKYRAWGDLKEFTNGNFATDKAFFSMQYDARLRLNRFEGSGRITEHDYYADGRVQEVRSPNNSDYKRTYNYDHAGRLTTANAVKMPTSPNDPYTFTYGYNASGDTESRTGTRWNNALPSFTATWTNGRNTNATYDAAGNQTASYAGATTPSQRYDAAGRASSNSLGTSVFGVNNDTLSYDGDGRVVRQVTEASINANPFSTAKRHYVRASVLDGVIIGEILDKGSILGNDPNRFENQSNMYLQGERIAYQKYTDRTGPNKEVVWVYKHPVIGSLLENNKLNYDVQGQVQALELTQALTYTDPLGSDLGYDPATLPQVQIDDPLLQLRFGDITDYSSGCMLDGVRTNCNIVQSALNNGWGVQAPEDLYGSRYNPNTGQYQLTRFTVDWDNGYYGYVPVGAKFGNSSSSSWYDPASKTEGRLRDSIKSRQVMRTMGMSKANTLPCLEALSVIFQNPSAVERAEDMMDEIIAPISKETGVPSALLAAAAIRETGFTNAKQVGGKGRGYLQIDLGYNPSVTEKQALDPVFNFTFAAKGLKAVYDEAIGMGYSSTVAWGAALHAHNSGGSWKDHLSGATDNDLSPLDVGTVKRKTGKKDKQGNDIKVADYVTTVWAIKKHCF